MSDITKRILTGTAYVTLLLFVIMQPISALVLFLLIAFIIEKPKKIINFE